MLIEKQQKQHPTDISASKTCRALGSVFVGLPSLKNYLKNTFGVLELQKTKAVNPGVCARSVYCEVISSACSTLKVMNNLKVRLVSNLTIWAGCVVFLKTNVFHVRIFVRLSDPPCF